MKDHDETMSNENDNEFTMARDAASKDFDEFKGHEYMFEARICSERIMQVRQACIAVGNGKQDCG